MKAVSAEHRLNVAVMGRLAEEGLSDAVWDLIDEFTAETSEKRRHRIVTRIIECLPTTTSSTRSPRSGFGT